MLDLLLDFLQTRRCRNCEMTGCSRCASLGASRAPATAATTPSRSADTESPSNLEDRFVDGRLPLATGAPREGTWQSALAQAMVESEFLPIKTICPCIIATIEHTRLDRGRKVLASGLDAELEETFILAIYREVASAFLSASLFPFKSHFLIVAGVIWQHVWMVRYT